MIYCKICGRYHSYKKMSDENKEVGEEAEETIDKTTDIEDQDTEDEE